MAPGAVTVVPDAVAGLAVLTPALRAGDVVLAKASRAVGLDVLAGRLLQAADDGAPLRAPGPPPGEDVPRGLVHGEARR
jgi:hypothetical protein